LYIDVSGCCSGEPIPEPEVDLSAFLARQRLQDDASPNLSLAPPVDDVELNDIDRSLGHITTARIASRSENPLENRKNKIQRVKWDRELEEMKREKEEADAQRGPWSFPHLLHISP
jgi:hypothetical protein